MCVRYEGDAFKPIRDHIIDQPPNKEQGEDEVREVGST